MTINLESNELKNRLKDLAFKLSTAFCYGCSKEAPSGKCSTCFSDDLMRLVKGVGVEFGTDWVMDHLVETNLSPVDEAQLFMDSLEGLYPETTTVGFLEVDTITAMKELDPVCFQMAQTEYIDNELSEGSLFATNSGGKTYQVCDLENYLDQAESKLFRTA